MYLLKHFNFDINDQDFAKSSALHWAAFLSKEIALCYLLAWGANPHLEDQDGNTPLHLAVLKTAENNF